MNNPEEKKIEENVKDALISQIEQIIEQLKAKILSVDYQSPTKSILAQAGFNDGIRAAVKIIDEMR